MSDNPIWDPWWESLYQGSSVPTSYPGSAESYEKAGAFLGGQGLVEEWGCATTFGKRYIHAPYRGVDGGPSEFVDVVADLSTYRSDVPRALIRHVLEHNWNWRAILDNFLLSFKERGVVVLFIPLGKHDINRSFEHRIGQPPTPPGLQLDEESFWSMLSHPDLVVKDEVLQNDTPPFGYERIIYLAKDNTVEIPRVATPRCTIRSCRRVATGQVRSDYVVLGNRFEYAFNACRKHQDDMLEGLYSLEKLPEVSWLK